MASVLLREAAEKGEERGNTGTLEESAQNQGGGPLGTLGLCPFRLAPRRSRRRVRPCERSGLNGSNMKVNDAMTNGRMVVQMEKIITADSSGTKLS